MNKHRYLTLVSAVYHLAQFRLTNASGAGVEISDVSFSFEGPGGEMVHSRPGGEHGTIVAWRKIGSGPENQVDMDTQLTTRILIKELGEDGGNDAQVNSESVLESLYLFVRDKVVHPLQPFVG